jgi:DNA-binding transcriptional ArsR family regulator
MADKSQVLDFLLAHANGWTALAQIRTAVNVPDRTLRNWLKDLVEKGAIESRGERKGRRYRLVERPAVIVPGANAIAVAGQSPAPAVQQIFTSESRSLIKRIEAPLYTRPPATYREEWLQTYLPNEQAYLTPKQRQELAALGKRDPIYRRAGTYIKKIYDRLLIDFSFNSSRLEATPTRSRTPSGSCCRARLGVMILAVMPRVTLGHTGRELKANRATVAVFVLINAAAVTRVCASWHTEFMTILLLAAGACWIAAFGLFELVYGPMLLTRRSPS